MHSYREFGLDKLMPIGNIWFIFVIISSFISILSDFVPYEKVVVHDVGIAVFSVFGGFYGQFLWMDKKNSEKTERYKSALDMQECRSFTQFQNGKFDAYVSNGGLGVPELTLLSEFKKLDQHQLFHQIIKANEQQQVLYDILELQFSGKEAVKEKYRTKGRAVYDTLLDNLSRYLELIELIHLADKNSVKQRVNSDTVSNIAKEALTERLNVINSAEELLNKIISDNQVLITKLNDLITLFAATDNDRQQSLKELDSTLLELESLIDRAAKYDVVAQS